jgi:integrase
MGEQRCPKCTSKRLYKDGLRPLSNGSENQRYICRECGYRFSEHILLELSHESVKQSINTQNTSSSNNQICALKAKNLEPQTETKTVAGEISNNDVKGKIVDFSFWMLKEGYSKSTIKTRTKLMQRFVRLQADIFNPESIKETIAKQQWSTGRKCMAIDTYTCFLKMQNLKWNPPIFNRIRKLPFIPTENEIDQLIGGTNNRMATFLQLLKETGVRCGEASQLLWTDLDTIDGSIIVTPEKGSNTRKLKISNKLTAMLNELPKAGKTVFNANSDALRKSYTKQRRLIAFKLKNPRLRQITFHTFRHWKATMEYHKTRDILHVMQVLGHRSIRNTMMYTQLVDFKEDDYIARIAHSEEETCQLIEAGFEFVCDFGSNKVFKKRK